MDKLQTITICALFALLGAALCYRWASAPRNRGTVSARRKWLTIAGAALACPAGWLLMEQLLGFLPRGWASWALVAGIALTSFCVRPPADTTAAERAATRRIQAGILIGGCILIAVCLLVFRPSRG